MNEGSVEFQRLWLLIDQLAQEYGRERGWPQRVAKRTGLSLSYVRKLHSGERTGTTVTKLDSVRRKMRLDPRFFSDPSLTDPHYADFVGVGADERETDVWVEFRSEYPRFDLLSERQVTQLLDMEFTGGKPSSAFVYRAMADWMLDGGARPSRPEAGEQAEAEGVRRVAAKYRPSKE